MAPLIRTILLLVVLLSPLPGQPVENTYVSPQACAECHPQVAAAFSKTGMGRSFYRPQDAPNPTPDATFFHQPSSTWYAITSRDGALYQKRWRAAPDGSQIHAQELRIDYILGSGNHARSYLHRTARGALVELPIAWYPEDGGKWAMAPGYDRKSLPAPRTVAYECMFCHNAYPRIPAANRQSGAEPLYTGDLPSGIDCQRCHGPGAAHIRAARAAVTNLAVVRAAIVNPSRLPADRAMEVCMQCHLETTSQQLPHSLLRFNRGPFSYRPGEPLGDFQIYYDRAPAARRDDFEIVSSAYRLRESPCYLKSAGKLICTTCHDPHREEHGDQAAAKVDRVCSGCHTAVASAPHPGKQDCASCHMPKRRTVDVVHAVMTDHRIQRRAPDGALAPLAERKETGAGIYQGEVVPYYPDALPATPENALYNAVAQVTHRSNLQAGLPRLAAELQHQNPARPEFYLELGQAYVSAGKTAPAIAAFNEAVRRAPQSPIAALNLADALTQSGQSARAVATLTRALAISSRDPLLYYQLGIAQTQAGHPAEAIAAFEKSAALDPDLTDAHNLLGAALAGQGQFERAQQELLRALEIYPDHADAQANLGHLYAAKGDFPAAVLFLEKAAAHQPGDAEVRVNYAAALAALNRFDEAREQIDAAVKADPKSADAHNLRGSLLERAGEMDAALEAFRTAARVRPAWGMPHFNAARLLAARGDRAAAIAELRAALADPDPRLQQRLQALLRQIQ